MKIQKNVSLFDKNWFKTGGNALFYAEPITTQEFIEALQYAKENALDVFVLGCGANILISDDGFDGLVIKPQLKDIVFDKTNGLVTAGAGVIIQDLIDECLDHGFIGLEEFSGIPGTVGGSVYINIHYFNYLLSNFLLRACVIERATGKLLEVDNLWFNFGYDQSRLFEKQYYLVHATFNLKQVDAFALAYAKGRRDEIVRHRNTRYPCSNTCGSFFRNFFENEVQFFINGKKILFVAYYLDKIGVKGELSVGNAIVSHQHANMLVTKFGATSADIIVLANKMQTMVHEKFGLYPQVECQFIGFNRNPLIY
jgi:UDP-N-acetylmuramate dehydrogenase